tara:strand:+ start:699 stop:890 length:192 start_codon:yes stop_codon:yes gene_type:complete
LGIESISLVDSVPRGFAKMLSYFALFMVATAALHYSFVVTGGRRFAGHQILKQHGVETTAIAA